MIGWLSEHHEVANVVINVGMLLVWVAYLHVFVSSYRRQKRANILISSGAGLGLDGRCLVSNMSQSPIYIRSIVLDVKTAAGAFSCYVTELEDFEEWDRPSDVQLWTRQGPLQPGAVRDMGTFRAMLLHALRAHGSSGAAQAPEAVDELKGFDLKIIGTYGPEDLLVAAEQSYTIDRRAGVAWPHPRSIEPRQIRSRWERRHLKARLEQDLRLPAEPAP